ncbi:glycosyl hydrolase-related protein [Candidatus Poribacteria bacterium]
MSENYIAIHTAVETIFFSHAGGELRQWITITIENCSDRFAQGEVSIEAGGERVMTQLSIAPGVQEYRCHAPVLWPKYPPVSDAPVCLTAGENVSISTTAVGNHRPWKVYLLSDVCTDYTWAYSDADSLRSDDAELTAAEMALAEATQHAPESDRNHYNFVHAREVEFYVEHHPDHAERLFEHIRQGNITFNPIFNMAMTCAMSLEELIRQLYPARAWATKHGLDMSYANHQETPTIAWGFVPVLAGSGVQHLVKSILPHECPWAKRLEEPPVFAWEGPDGSSILVRRRNENYTEGRFALTDLQASNASVHDTIVPDYENLGERYPFGAVGLVGCYGDLTVNSKTLPAKKAATIAAYNAQDWEYPKLINASHKQFWDDIDSQIAERQVEVPTYRGDYGTSWDAWPASLAYDAAAWRRAQERAGVADKLAAVLSFIDQDLDYEKLSQGWMNLIYLADHAWNGSGDSSRALNASLRRKWQITANDAFDSVIADGLAELSKQIPTEESNRIMVFNSLGWSRTGLVQADAAGGECQIVDVAIGEAVPSQVMKENGDSVVRFEARDVPSVGYRIFEIQQTDEQSHEGEEWKHEGHRLDGPLYAVEVCPVTGGIVSLYDKTRERELVDADSPYHLNQCLYFSDEVEYTPDSAEVEVEACGPVYGQLVVRSTFRNIQLTTTITMYAGIDRVDIRNELEKPPTTEKQELDFAFPFMVPDRQYRLETPGYIMTPGVDQRPGSGQAVTAVRHFVDVFNEDFGVTLSQADSFLVEFGHRTILEDPLGPDLSNSMILALAMDNCVNYGEVTRDQGGAMHFVFRYSLRGHDGGFDPATALHFGWEDNNELMAIPLSKGQNGDIPADMHSFLEVTPDNVILTCLKVAEEDGVIARLWECAGRDTDATLTISNPDLLKAARLTDLMERDKSDLDITDGQVIVPVRKRGLATVRLLSNSH